MGHAFRFGLVRFRVLTLPAVTQSGFNRRFSIEGRQA